MNSIGYMYTVQYNPEITRLYCIVYNQCYSYPMGIIMHIHRMIIPIFIFRSMDSIINAIHTSEAPWTYVYTIRAHTYSHTPVATLMLAVIVAVGEFIHIPGKASFSVKVS